MNDKWIESETLELDSLCLRNGKLKIPSYQRGYEWDAYNVQRLVYSVCDGAQEDTFLGTIQIANNNGESFIVDGRQRLTTLALLNAVIAKKLGAEPKRSLLELLDDPLLDETLNKIKSKTLEVFSTIGNSGDITRLNRQGKNNSAKIENIYYRNACFINTIFEGNHFKTPLSKENAESMFATLFFIVVSIKDKELTQVIRIFDTLNSTGQELSEEAMFKLRYHSYLRTADASNLKSEEIMERINEGYQKVDSYNSSADKLVQINMRDVLWGYRTFLLTLREVKAELQTSDMTLGTLSFFENLFNKPDKVFADLSLECFSQYIDYHLEYYKYAYPSNMRFDIDSPDKAIKRILPDILAWSRYGSSWALPVAFYASYRRKGDDKETAYSKAAQRAIPIFQALYYYSVIYQKSVKRIKTSFLWDAIDKENQTDVNAFCLGEIKKAEADRKKWGYRPFWTTVSDNFYWEYGRAYVFLAVIEAYENMNGEKDFYKFLHTVFPWERKAKRPQIEHIFCKRLFEDDKYLGDAEKAKLNGLGNFVLLEEGINKGSLKDHPPSDKFRVSQTEKDFFPRSSFSSVKRLRSDYEERKKDGCNYDSAREWVNVANYRFEAMKAIWISLFPAFRDVE